MAMPEAKGVWAMLFRVKIEIERYLKIIDADVD